MSVDGADELSLGSQSISRSMIRYMDLDDLHTIYTEELAGIPDTSHLPDIHDHMTTILAAGSSMARDALATHGIEMGDVEAKYEPGLEGAEYVGEGTFKVGQPGKMDRPYYLVTELSHEMLHTKLRQDGVVDEYTPAEEGLTRFWNLYHDDVLEAAGNDTITTVRDDYASDEAVQRLDEARTLYNDHIDNGFGDEMHDYARHFIGMYHNANGTPEERATEVLDYAVDHVL